MADVDAGAAMSAKEPVGTEATEPKPGRVKETNYNGQVDPFAVAFNAAKDELAGAEEKPKKEPVKKPEAKPVKPVKQVKAEDAEEPKSEASYAKADDESDDDGDEDGEAPAPKKKVALEPKKYWPERRKEAFRFQPREVQEAWVTEDPAPNERWPTEIKEGFAKLPVEAKELVLSQVGELERGFTQKFQTLAGERKLAEDIRNAVPAAMRNYMQQRGLSEPQVFAKLLQHQHQSMSDPVGYVRQFIANNKINPLDIIPSEGGQVSGQQGAPQADVKSHPEYQALLAEYDVLHRSVANDRAQRAQEENRRFASEFDGIMSEKDGDGDSLYPYVRVLAEPMARIIEADPEFFDSMGTKERFATAYRMAWQEHPELPNPKRTVKPPLADEQGDEPTHTEAEERAAKLEKAITPKSKTPQTAPTKNKAGDPFDEAFEWAKKQLKR